MYMMLFVGFMTDKHLLKTNRSVKASSISSIQRASMTYEVGQNKGNYKRDYEPLMRWKITLRRGYLLFIRYVKRLSSCKQREREGILNIELFLQHKHKE